MRPARPRWSALLFWACAALATLIVLAYAANGRWRYKRNGARSITEIVHGVVHLHWNPRRTDSSLLWNGWSLWPVEPQRRWIYRPWAYDRGTNGIGGWRFLLFPFWPAALPPLLIATALGLRRRRSRLRLRAGACTNCGYDLRGLAPGLPCPECGVTRPSTATART